MDLNLTGTDIVNLLKNNDKAVAKALIVLYKRQTMDEQDMHASRHNNERGFTKADANKGTEHALFYMKNGYLTADMIAYWRAPIKRTNGYRSFRIAIYWRQLLKQAYSNHYAKLRQAA